ncbi:putative leader peptide [Streptomyces sp. NPDC002004]
MKSAAARPFVMGRKPVTAVSVPLVARLHIDLCRSSSAACRRL